MTSLRFTVPGFALLMLSACVLPGDGPAASSKAPSVSVPAAFTGTKPAADTAQSPQWWAAFRDSRLDALMQQGLAQNLDVQQAVARISEARANAGLAGAADLPQLSATGSAGRSDLQGKGADSSSSVGLNTSWMIDLFGANRAAKRSAAAQLDAAYLSADVARLAILAEIATTYADLRFYQHSIALTQDSLSGRRKSLSLTREKFDLGSVARLDVLQAEQLVAVAEAELPALEVGYDQAIYRLATLTGQSASRLRADLQKGTAQPRPRYRAAIGVPADVLRNRPDIRKAERDLASAAASVGVARAALYPSLSLGGTVTASEARASGALTTWSFGPQISLPIFDGGRNRANLRGAESRAVQAELAWKSAVTKAVEEVEAALSAYRRDARNIGAQDKLVSTSRQTLDLARAEFDLGQGDFLAVLDAERTEFDARRALAQAIRAEAAHYVALSLATAGGVPVAR